MHKVDLYFDFISPYSWLALARAEEFCAENNAEFVLRPVVYAALLNATGLTGPAEEPAKRRYTFVDVLRAARANGLALVGPPAHPFRSLDALRLVTSELHDTHSTMRLARAIAAACWEHGRDLADREVLRDVAHSVNLGGDDVQSRIANPEVKAALHTATDDALAAGVFGVPTFVYRAELFWGFDRMPQLADVLTGRRDSIDIDELRDLLARPRGVDRRAGPQP